MRRRTVVLSAIVGTLAGALTVARRTAAQDDTPDALATHPLVGTWAAMTPGGVVPQTYGPDGSFIAAYPPTYIDSVLGLSFQGPALGRWESTGARSGRFTFLQALTDGAGTSVGTYQLAADIEASADGQTWAGPTTARAIGRDAGNAVIFDEVLQFDTPVTATRIGATIESVVLPAATPLTDPAALGLAPSVPLAGAVAATAEPGGDAAVAGEDAAVPVEETPVPVEGTAGGDDTRQFTS